MVRRLHVIQTPSASDEAVHRPSWRWVLLGAGLALALWAAMAALLLPLGAKMASSMVGPAEAGDSGGVSPRARLLTALWTAGPVVVAFALAVGASGFLVVRFGPAPATRGAAVGLAAAGIAWTFAAISGAFGTHVVAIFALIVLLAVGAGAGLLAGRLGAVHVPPAEVAHRKGRQ